MCVKLKACAHFTARGLSTIYEQSNVTASSLRAANLIPNGYYNEACRPHQAAAALEWAEQRALCLSLPFCHQRTKDTKSLTNERSGVFGKQKKKMLWGYKQHPNYTVNSSFPRAKVYSASRAQRENVCFFDGSHADAGCCLCFVHKEMNHCSQNMETKNREALSQRLSSRMFEKHK